MRIGARAFCILSKEHPHSKSRSPGKATVIGAAKVEVIEALASGRYRVKCLHASPHWWVGRELELGRGQLYAATDPAEHAAFSALVTRYWGNSDGQATTE